MSAGSSITRPDRTGDRRRVRTRRRVGAAAAIGAIAVLAAACGSSSSSPTTTSGAGSSSTSTGATTSGSSSNGSSPVVGVAHSGSTGLILVDRGGKTLYRYTPDGTGKTTCTGGCASIWPPLTVPAGTTKVTGASSIPGSELGTVPGANGTLVVTFKGMPLYTYTGDTQTGQTNGQGVAGIWFTVPVASTQSASGSGSSTTSSSTASGYGY